MTRRNFIRTSAMVGGALLVQGSIPAMKHSGRQEAADGQEQTIPGEDEGDEGNEGDEGGNVAGTNGRYLVLYCSRTGNTESMAQAIQSTLISTSESDAATLVPDATFAESLLLTSGTLGNMENLIPAWLEELGSSRETSLGGIDNVEEDELRTALGEGSVTVTFSLDNNG